MKFSRRGRVTLIAAAALASTLALSACGGGGAETPDSDAPLTITVAATADLISFDPGKLQGGQQLNYWQPVYETLIRRDANGTLVPNVAESWEFVDPTTFTMTIKEGLTYADGSDISPDTIVEGIERFRGGDGPDATYLDAISDTAIDGSTITFTLSSPDPGLPFKFASTSGAVANPASFDTADVDTVPGASGAYILDEEGTTPGSRYHYVRNENYWDPEAYPYDEVTVVFLEDLTARSNALKSGQVDVAVLDGASAADIEAAGKTITQQSAAWEGYWIWDRTGQLNPALGDVRVRQAMNMAIDREGIVDKLMLGFGFPTEQIWRDPSPASVEGADAYAYDVEGAKELLADAGYPDGFDLDIPSLTGVAYLEPTIADQFAAIGVRVNWVSVPAEQYFPNIARGDYAISYWRYTHDSTWVDITRWITPDAQMNPLKTQTPELDALIEDARVATNDDDANAAYQSIGEYIYDNAWFLPTNFNVQVVAHDSDIEVETQVGQSVIPIYNYSPAS